MANLAKPVAALDAGNRQRQQKTKEAQALLDHAGRRRAAASREARDEERSAEYIKSRARAVAAKSGGGSDGQGMVALMGDLAAEGEYRVLSRLWAGYDEAEGIASGADAALAEGKAATKASYVNAVTSVMSGVASGFGIKKKSSSNRDKYDPPTNASPGG